MSGERQRTHERLFLALEPEPELRRGLAAWGERELRDEAIRVLAEETLHVTLCFLGRTPRERIAEVADALAAIEPRAVELTPRAAPAAVPGSRPRLYAIELDAPAAGELQAELSARLEAAGLYTPEKRPFWAHITVAKVRPERGTRRPRRVRNPPGELPPPLVRTFDSVRVALYRSILRPSGAEYSPLASLDLPPGASAREAGKR